ncbi:phosphatase PAP2 family protein [Lentibacter sp. XHP0401]|uniref:phosphatase PAP2 family protein n=1 Tax=Lentibacter sp. XHP0401 TaxID=2984334 RepID=UPI0021E8DA64|nr:phosphatase PAP2 family protein [Lentibacter sp. XHP0401]MCV2894795.1 phosphatase PAP2 family protein [Lentibacter sp. XHP0401]
MVRWSNYVCIGVLTVLNIGILTFSRAEIVTAKLPEFFLQGLILLAIFVAARRLLEQAAQPAKSLVRLHYAFEGLFFLHIAWLNLRLLNHLSMMIPFPYVDDLLVGWDQALNLNWMAYFEAVYSRPQLFQLLDVSYTSLTFLSLVILLLLVSVGYIERAREFIDTFMITAVVCIVVGAAFPAKAAVLTLFQDLSLFKPMGWVPGAYHLPYMEALRDSSTATVLDPARMPGLATFPSFHTASGILIISVCRNTWLSIPAWLYSIVMISSTPVLGGHYFVDLIAGMFVALMAIKMVHRFNGKSRASAQFQQGRACVAA